MALNLACPKCSSKLVQVPQGKFPNFCDCCNKELPQNTPSYFCNVRHLHKPVDSYDICQSCASAREEQYRFNLQKWLCSKAGREWAEEVYVRAEPDKLNFCAPPVQWEDIDRHSSSSSGHMIFDVVVRMKDQPQDSTRYVLRPENFTDKVQKRKATDISLPIGQLTGAPLQALSLADLLSPGKNGNKAPIESCGFKGEVKDSLYEAGMDAGRDGGIAFSSGVTFMSETDVGKEYEVEVFMYRTYGHYRDAKCLCLVQTTEGTSCSLVTPGEKTTLKFGKNGKECAWRIAKFDTSTEEGRKAEMTGCDPCTDMMIFFVPVSEGPLRSDSGECDEDESISELYGSGSGRGGFRGGRGGSRGGRAGGSKFSYPFGMKAKAQKKKVDERRQRSRSRSRERDRECDRGLRFAQHEMVVTDRDFSGSKSKLPLERIRQLPIRGFLRGAIFMDQITAPTRYDAVAVSNYLQSKYADVHLNSIWGFCAQARARAKLLPIYKPTKVSKPEAPQPSGVFSQLYTEYAAKNNEMCVVCISTPITHVLLKCGHMCLCAGCIPKWSSSRLPCPICRAEVDRVLPELSVDKSTINVIPQAIKD